jgi:integral membrane protein
MVPAIEGLRNMRLVALAEAPSFLLLLIASYVKRAGGGETGVQILGPIHGILFIAYLVLALGVRREMGWSGKTLFWVLLGAVIPFGGYVVDWKLLRDEQRPA